MSERAARRIVATGYPAFRSLEGIRFCALTAAYRERFVWLR